MDDLLTRFFGPLIRQGLTIVAGYFAAKGIAFDDTFWVDVTVALTTAVASFGWSLWEKAKAAKLVQVALQLPANTPLAVAVAKVDSK
jgi:uncharacterized SAM-binding protein YcdF (DUF218 family)